MKLWDTSALLSLLLSEEGSGQLEQIASSDRKKALWWGTKMEAIAGVRRQRRVDAVGEPTLLRLISAIERAAAEAYEIQPTQEVRKAACRLLRVHELRAADALQLAAAVVWCDHDPSGRGFVCLDARLRNAAEREGFDVLPKSPDGR